MSQDKPTIGFNGTLLNLYLASGDILLGILSTRPVTHFGSLDTF